jgi:hypothetical protein
MRIVAEEVDEEIFMDIVLLEEEVLAVLNGEFLHAGGTLGRREINITIARGESYKYATEKRKE